RALVMYIIADPIPSFWSSPSDGHGDVPNHCNVVELAPMWKCTGMASPEHVSQRGSHTRSPRSGSEHDACGSLVMFTPRMPIPAARSASAMDASMSHHGSSAIG